MPLTPRHALLLCAVAIVACREGDRPVPSRPPSTGQGSVPPAPVSASAPAPASSLRAAHIQLAAAVRKGIPAGSADYADALAWIMLHRRGRMDFPALQEAIGALELPPHPLGDGYLLVPSPRPPPGTPFDPAMMPHDWKGTWGEVAMAYHLGELDRSEYERLHAAAHPACPSLHSHLR